MPRLSQEGEVSVEECLTEDMQEYDLFYRPGVLKGFVISVARKANAVEEDEEEVKRQANRIQNVYGVKNFVSEEDLKRIGIDFGPMDIVRKARRSGADPEPIYRELINLYGCEALREDLSGRVELAEKGNHPAQRGQLEFEARQEFEGVTREFVMETIREARQGILDEVGERLQDTFEDMRQRFKELIREEVKRKLEEERKKGEEG